ncbi:MAG TPA: 1,2-phenylacetyl-CoA epoxidase subunit PaaD [Jatrophihabitans sp.]|jgi:ring-1,2-phenylacetyl-CoA epoxidase subunit PaaD|nr:1,2-phenylacetyl-CoA epoxidase subunit PaaD [Jatrophihabitans sp.]
MVTRSATAWDVAATTPDPELPMLTIGDLGILRAVDESADRVVATITPTYSGCPALREITADLERRLRAAGHREVEIRTQLAPPWTSDWITDAGRGKLAEAGIAPPAAARPRTGPVPLTLGRRASATCPRCGSAETVETAAFGATACKSLHRCTRCDEPFEAVKPL